MLSRTFVRYYFLKNSCNASKSNHFLKFKSPLSRNANNIYFTPKYCNSNHIHTSKKLHALPPLLWLIVKPVAKITAALTGRGFRQWWRSLPSDKKTYFIQVIKTHRLKIGASVTGVSALSAGYYVSHLQETPFTHRKRFVAFTPSQFNQISQHEFESIWEQYKKDVIPASHPTMKRVLRVANRLLHSNDDIPQVYDHKWTVTVVKDPAENAFVLPSGQIFVFTGMLNVCENDDQLGIVLSHEMSHAILGHGPELVSYGHLIDLVMIVVIGAIWFILPTDGISLLFQYLSNKMTELLLHLPYNRMLENEADEVGLHLAAKACFDIRESSAFWTKMEVRSTMKGEEEIEWLSTHPTHGNRSQRLDELIPNAMEVRTQSKCRHLAGVDPRQEVELFKKAMLKALKPT